MSDQGVGASVERKEDDRFLRGRGQYVGDIRLAGMKDVAFVRSPLAHAKLRGIHIPDEHRGNAFTAADVVGVEPIVAVSGLPGFKASQQPVLASHKMRQVGELIAMCAAPTRARLRISRRASRSISKSCRPCTTCWRRACRTRRSCMSTGATTRFLRVCRHQHRSGPRRADQGHARDFHRPRCMAPMEGRGTVAYWDGRMDRLVLYTGSQMPQYRRVPASRNASA